jgi:hypothetical protein
MAVPECPNEAVGIGIAVGKGIGCQGTALPGSRVSKMTNNCPSRIKGNLEISKSQEGVFIGGDPQGLHSLAKLLIWLANVDQEKHPSMPDGEREHVHLYADPASAQSCLTRFSVTTELCRLDAKGTGEFPKEYRKL